ncbi:MAG: hypothetical protein E6R15_03820 [Zoogloea sp.]|nr:MAG: hypothetical protein E6R15_03820 [Zoogloea sp.]
MDAYVWSFEVRAIKPDPIIYQAACEALHVKPGEILMIGDRMRQIVSARGSSECSRCTLPARDAVRIALS